MLPASVGSASKESINITKCPWWQIQSNRQFLTVMTKLRKKIFLLENEKWDIEMIPAKAIHLSGKIPKVYLHFSTFSPPFLLPLSFVFCQKQLGLTLQAVTSRPSPVSYNGGEFCSWIEQSCSQTPNHRLHSRGVKTEVRKIILFEPEFVPWGQTYYNTLKEVFHAVTEQIYTNKRLWKEEDWTYYLLSYLELTSKSLSHHGFHYSTVQ